MHHVVTSFVVVAAQCWPRSCDRNRSLVPRRFRLALLCRERSTTGAFVFVLRCPAWPLARIEGC
eukprot:10285988-Heterocapsa_arctica.AAC.1